MSPEQAAGETLDARADVYAAGVLLYRLVSGRLPFSESNMAKLLLAHLYRPPDPFGEPVPAQVAVVVRFAGFHSILPVSGREASFRADSRRARLNLTP